MFYILGVFLVFLFYSQNDIVTEEKLLINFCLALAWPVFVIGLIWINRFFIKQAVMVFFNLDDYVVLEGGILETDFDPDLN